MRERSLRKQQITNCLFYSATVVSLCLIGTAMNGVRSPTESTSPEFSSGAQSFRPFTVERQFISYTEDPEGKVIRTDVRGRSSDGTLYIRVDSSSDSSGGSVTQALTAKGLLLRMSEEARIRSSATLTDDELEQHHQRLSDGIAGCGRRFEIPAGSEVIFGYPVEAWQWEYLDGNGFLARLTAYRSPECGCLPVREVFEELEADGQYKLRWETRPVSIREVEPDLELFGQAAAFPEVSFQEFVQKSGNRTMDLVNLVRFGVADPVTATKRGHPNTTKPDFNATWNLDLAESHDRAMRALPYRSNSLILAHNEPYLDIVQSLSTDRGDRVVRLAVTTDGQVYNHSAENASASWDGDTLVLSYDDDSSKGRVHVERRMRLSDDGLQMHSESTTTGEGVTLTAIEIWNRKMRSDRPK